MGPKNGYKPQFSDPNGAMYTVVSQASPVQAPSAQSTPPTPTSQHTIPPPLGSPPQSSNAPPQQHLPPKFSPYAQVAPSPVQYVTSPQVAVVSLITCVIWKSTHLQPPVFQSFPYFHSSATLPAAVWPGHMYFDPGTVSLLFSCYVLLPSASICWLIPL